MGNRSFLYITRPKDKSAGEAEIADANAGLARFKKLAAYLQKHPLAN